MLLLLDEVLKYMERAAAVAVQESTLQRQAKDFLQNLTVEVAGSKTAVMVYSLQWSAREALANVALLQELDKLTSRVDQVREPVTGDEVLSVVKRRLLDGDPARKSMHRSCDRIRQCHRRDVESTSGNQLGETRSRRTRDPSSNQRLIAAYPFHPALIDVMNSRWTSVDGFQRRRARCSSGVLSARWLKRKAGAGKPLLGPGDIPLFRRRRCRAP